MHKISKPDKLGLSPYLLNPEEHLPAKDKKQLLATLRDLQAEL
jgi:hypothetical protein